MTPNRLVPALAAALATALVSTGQPAPAAAAVPEYTVQLVAGGLTIPWDVTWVGEVMLVNERAGRLWSKREGRPARRVELPLPRIYHRSEGGLLGMVADPDAANNRYFYTCQSVATASGAAKDVQVWKWRLDSDTTAVKVRTLVTGIPIGSGRHNGCRLRFNSARALYIGTGDAARGTNPQQLSSLGGKVLRVRSDGTIPKSNPFYSRGGRARYVWTYGHRNVQGLAKRPGVGELWSAEHGPSRDDEINLVVRRANYGWSPTPGYNESRSMTDPKRYPKARKAIWRSGSPTVATSGATFLSGSRWGDWDGALAVAMLKGEGVLLFGVGPDRKLTRLGEIASTFGRVRTVEQGPDGALYFTTSNGSSDGVYRLVPA